MLTAQLAVKFFISVETTYYLPCLEDLSFGSSCHEIEADPRFHAIIFSLHIFIFFPNLPHSSYRCFPDTEEFRLKVLHAYIFPLCKKYF